MYSLIRTAAFMPDRSAGSWCPELHQMLFPKEIGEILTRFHAVCKPRSAKFGLPIRPLNSLLFSAAPGVLAIGRGATSGLAPWIYAREPVPFEIIRALINTWVMGWTLKSPKEKEREAELQNEAVAVLETVGGRLPGWSSTPVDLMAASTTMGGTELPDPRLYSLLPEYVAYRLSAVPFVSDRHRLRFRVVTTDQGADIVSWPPLSFPFEGHEWRYSAFVKISTQTTPFTGPFRIHTTVGIRRWMTQGPIDLKGRTATVLFDLPSPWAVDAERHRLIGNRVRVDRDKGAVWKHGSPVDLLSTFDVTRSYPRPDQLLANPATWLAGQGDVAAGVVYSAALGKHGVGAGLMPVERRELDEWLESVLSPEFCRVPDLVRVPGRNKPELVKRPSSGDPERRAELARVARRSEALAAALGGKTLDVGVLWQSDLTMDRLATELRGLLDLPIARVQDDGSMIWEAGEFTIRMHGRAAGALVDKLKLPPIDARPRAERLAEAMRARRLEVRTAVTPVADTRCCALVETRSADHFSGDSDPKFAVRLGLADARRVSQFIVIDEDSDVPFEIRARSAWLDLFRQLGAVSLPPHQVGERIPKDLQYVGVWLVSRRSDGPTRQPGERLVAVRVRPGEGRLPVQAWDRVMNDWVPYPDFLVSLAADVDLSEEYVSNVVGDDHSDVPFEATGNGSDVESELRALLHRIRGRPTLLVVNSANLRGACSGMTNGRLRPDMLEWSDLPAQRISVFGPDLRVVLIRDDSGRFETPQWYAPGVESEDAGLSLGLWALPDAAPDNRVFASTADGPRTMKGLPRGLRKLFPNEDHPTAPSKAAWNPQLLEITVLGCVTAADLAFAGRDDITPDCPADYAALVHQLRFHDDFDPLRRPLVQHWAMKAGEYLLPLVGSRESELADGSPE